MKRATIGCLIGAGLLAGCASTSSEVQRKRPEDQGGVEARPYMPLAVGAGWTYEATDIENPAGQRVQVRIVDFVKGFYRDSGGTEYRHTASGLRDRNRYLIRNPVRVGGKWKVVRNAKTVERFEVVSVGEPCAVPAGRFADCVVIKSFRRRPNGREAQHVYYTWVKDVGLARVMVEGEIKGKGRFKQSELVLLEYRPPTPSTPARGSGGPGGNG